MLSSRQFHTNQLSRGSKVPSLGLFSNAKSPPAEVRPSACPEAADLFNPMEGEFVPEADHRVGKARSCNELDRALGDLVSP
jgi:hypothetical protein